MRSPAATSGPRAGCCGLGRAVLRHPPGRPSSACARRDMSGAGRAVAASARARRPNRAAVPAVHRRPSRREHRMYVGATRRRRGEARRRRPARARSRAAAGASWSASGRARPRAARAVDRRAAFAAPVGEANGLAQLARPECGIGGLLVGDPVSGETRDESGLRRLPRDLRDDPGEAVDDWLHHRRMERVRCRERRRGDTAALQQLPRWMRPLRGRPRSR